MNPAVSNRARWFSQLGSLISTLAPGSSFLRKSAPIFRPPVPPSACTVATRPLLLRHALKKSINTVAIRVTYDLKPETVAAMAKKMGFAKVTQLKAAVAIVIKDYVSKGGFMFGMCSATDTYDIALAAWRIEEVTTMPVRRAPIAAPESRACSMALR